MRKRLVSVSCVGILVALVLPACTSAKVTECANFGKINQEIQSSFNAVQMPESNTKNDNKDAVVAFKQLAKDNMTFALKVSLAAEKSGKSITGMTLTDEKLKTYQAEYLAWNKKIKDAYDKLSAIHAEQSTVTKENVKDPKFLQLGENVDKIAENQKSLDQEQDKILEGIATYCGVSVKSSTPSPSVSASSTPSPSASK
jgi:predicted  nucleic acid-binding Zn-ribbon protein